MIEKVLIANRGEVACRIIRTAKKIGLKTVAIYSKVDINSLHVAMADEAVLVGEATSSRGYLDMTKIVNVCKSMNIKYVHPGWGFLSENYKFAQALEKEGIIFVGPSSNAIKLMGDKIQSKKIAEKCGVSVIPSIDAIIDNLETAKNIAKKIKYPIVLKAVAGGGGKGIRVVFNEKELKIALENVINEAKGSFNDGRIFIEKYIENPRHIEIQIIGDKSGNIVCLGERDCSIQRNNQKIIEETPCPIMDARTRNKMYAQAVALAKKTNYYSAGTLEFLMNDKNEFYFMEMNTRLQVEHTVTEMATGLDIVELMFKVADNEVLPFKQINIKPKGHAMECRINAENVAKNFIPSIGKINKYIEPPRSDSVRIDTSVYEGYDMNIFYDNMLVKLISYGKNRSDALSKMRMALSGFYIEGVHTNIQFLETMLNNEDFINGNFDTSFIKNKYLKGLLEDKITKSEESIFISSAISMYIQCIDRYLTLSYNGYDENNFHLVCDVSIINNDDNDNNNSRYSCRVIRNGAELNIEYDDISLSVTSNWILNNNIFRGIIDKKEINVRIISQDWIGGYVLQYKGITSEIKIHLPHVAELLQYMPPKLQVEKPTSFVSPITGNLAKLFIEKGQKVLCGEELFIIEAMKMENVIRADYDVIIKDIKFKQGDLIKTNDIIVDYEYIV
ncbi:MAG: ATP-grasp domain-containing protein [Rickettsiales bacterium]|jgi:propionyl-CoA carboxylase alpha chain|nr:ATP-grasp domain-containing protein [Rickettsiales bacterium]